MPMDFSKAGYTTFGTGKWHNEKEAFEASFQQAKNVYLGGMANHYSIPLDVESAVPVVGHHPASSNT